MIEGATREVWRLPTGLRFLETTTDVLTSGGVVSLLLDDWVDRSAFIDELRWHLSSRGLTLQALADRDGVAETAIERLAQGLGLPSVQSRYDAPGDAMRRLLGCDDLPHVSAVDVAESGGLDARVWGDFARGWAKASKSISDAGGAPPALCLMLPPSTAMDHDLPTDAYLTVEWMMGVPDALELRLLCRLADDDDSRAVRRWREHVIPALCGSDLGLLEHLWDAVLGDHAAVLAALSACATHREWTGERLIDAGVDAHPAISTADSEAALSEMAPPPRLRQAWSTGALTSTTEHGVEANSAALLPLGAEDVLMQRLWRGQVALLMPGIDGMRMAMCSQLTRRFGPRWATEYDVPLLEDEARAVRESPLACQWGHLLFLLKRHGRLRDFAEWIPLAMQARKVRNHLAHGSPISFDEYASLRAEAQKQDFDHWL